MQKPTLSNPVATSKPLVSVQMRPLVRYGRLLQPLELP